MECCNRDPLFVGVNYCPVLNALVLAIGENLLDINNVTRPIVDIIGATS